MNANTRDRIQISNFHAILLADPTVYTSNIVLSPLDTADAGKHKLCDGVQTYAELPFIEDGGGGGSGMTQLTGDVTAGPGTGSQAATIPADTVTNAQLAADAPAGTTIGRALPGVGEVSYLIASEQRLNAGFPENIGTPGALLGANAGATAYEERTPAQVRAAAGLPDEYTAILNQGAAAAPVATGVKNQLGGVPVWARTGAGAYTLTITGAFPAGRTKCFLTGDINATLFSCGASRIDDNTVGIISSTNGSVLEDDLLIDASFMIRVDPA